MSAVAIADPCIYCFKQIVAKSVIFRKAKMLFHDIYWLFCLIRRWLNCWWWNSSNRRSS